MDKKVQDSVIAKQEKAARQQELLEKKRQARAEYNISGGRSGEQREKKHQEQVLKKQQKQLEIRQEKQEKKKKRFSKSFQKAVAFDDAEGVSVVFKCLLDQDSGDWIYLCFGSRIKQEDTPG